jgi:hypothetical protein
MTRKIFVQLYFALAEGVVSGEIRFLPGGVEATVIMVAAVACIAPAGGASTSSWRRAWSAIWSAATKTAKTSTGHTRIASIVVRSTSVVLVNRVVAKEVATSLRVGHCRAWAVGVTSTLLGHAVQNKRRVSVHQRPLILEACSSYC